MSEATLKIAGEKPPEKHTYRLSKADFRIMQLGPGLHSPFQLLEVWETPYAMVYIDKIRIEQSVFVKKTGLPVWKTEEGYYLNQRATNEIDVSLPFPAHYFPQGKEHLVVGMDGFPYMQAVLILREAWVVL